MTNKNTEVTRPAQEFPLLETSQAMQKTLRMIDEKLNAQEFDPLKLLRIKVEKGSGEFLFIVETASGSESARTLVGAITAYRISRTYWGRAYTGSRERPACTSKDGFIGEGKPGGKCTECPLAKFDRKTNQPPECKELRQLLILLPGQWMPHRLDVPPVSLTNFDKYIYGLGYTGASYWEVTTKLTLEPGTSAGGFKVGRIHFALYARLNDDQTSMLSPYHDRMHAALKPMIVDATAYEILEPTPPQAGPSATGEAPEDDEVPF